MKMMNTPAIAALASAFSTGMTKLPFGSPKRSALLTPAL